MKTVFGAYFFVVAIPPAGQRSAASMTAAVVSSYYFDLAQPAAHFFTSNPSGTRTNTLGSLYDGDHGSRIKARFSENLLPFFTANLTPAK